MFGATTVYKILKCLWIYATPDKGSYKSLFTDTSTGIENIDNGPYMIPVAKEVTPSKLA